jgi:hypothetical protein
MIEEDAEIYRFSHAAGAEDADDSGGLVTKANRVNHVGGGETMFTRVSLESRHPAERARLIRRGMRTELRR